MKIDDENLVWINMCNPPPGRRDPSRAAKRGPADTEPRPVVTAEDIEATLRLAREENWPGGEDRVRRLLEPWK